MLGTIYFRISKRQILAIMCYESCDGIINSRDIATLKCTYEFNELFKKAHLKNPPNSSSRGSVGSYFVTSVNKSSTRATMPTIIDERDDDPTAGRRDNTPTWLVAGLVGWLVVGLAGSLLGLLGLVWLAGRVVGWLVG